MLKHSKSYHYLKSSCCFLMMLVCCKSYGQSMLFDAQRLCNEKKYAEAVSVIDKAILDPETKNDPAAWHIRAFAYIQTYKQAGAGNISKIYLLDTAMASTIKAKKFDSKNEYLENNNAFLKNGASSYFKVSLVLLQDSLNPDKSEKYYNTYKKLTLEIDPTFDMKQQDIKYYNAKGGIFEDLYMKNNFNQKYGDIAKSALLKVIELDPKNIKANMNLGILYYNQGATLMRMMDYDVDLAQLDVIQENAKKLFKQSLPFMIKVYELDPKEAKALESLQGIYSALLDDEKANEFKQKKELLEK